MNYQRIYTQFIDDRRAREPTIVASGVYTERHHVVPRSMGGGNEAANLIRLTAEDHIRAHLLLAKIHGGKMWAPIIVIASNRGRRVPTRRMMRIAANAVLMSAAEITVWTKDACIASALKFKSRKEWHKNEGAAYLAAKKYGYFLECVSHMPDRRGSSNKKRRVYSDEDIASTARLCSTAKEWSLNFPHHANAATKLGIYKTVTAHFVRSPAPNKGSGRKVLCLDTGRRFKTRVIAETEMNITPGGLWRALTGKADTAKGLRWAYI